MNYTVEGFFESLKDKKICFIGAGVSHKELIELFARKGLDVTLRDKKTKEEMGELSQKYEDLGVRLILGESYLQNFDEDIIFRTPGFYFRNQKLKSLMEEGRIVTSELEVFLKICPCKTYGITGSDGKTTTTTIISKLLEKEGKRVFLGGNIGAPLLSRIFDIKPTDVAVVELSSFQLLSMREKIDTAVITNISPNHLDVHGTMEEYIFSKENIISHQDGFGRAVLNADCEYSRPLKEKVRGSLFEFSLKTVPQRGCYCDEKGELYFTDGKEKTFIINESEIKIPGKHNVANYMTAACAVWGDVKVETIRELAREFGGVSHRIEFVREIDGVRYYNDSIATTPTRTVAGLKAFDDSNNILIAGGYDKKIPFEPMCGEICKKVKAIILIGETADKIETAIKSCDEYKDSSLLILREKTFENAIKMAKETAKKGDRVLLSPACASFDMFPNFETRGEEFRRIVNAL